MGEYENDGVAGVNKLIDDVNEIKRIIDTYGLATPQYNFGYYLVLKEKAKALEASELKLGS